MAPFRGWCGSESSLPMPSLSNAPSGVSCGAALAAALTVSVTLPPVALTVGSGCFATSCLAGFGSPASSSGPHSPRRNANTARLAQSGSVVFSSACLPPTTQRLIPVGLPSMSKRKPSVSTTGKYQSTVGSTGRPEPSCASRFGGASAAFTKRVPSTFQPGYALFTELSTAGSGVEPGARPATG